MRTTPATSPGETPGHSSWKRPCAGTLWVDAPLPLSDAPTSRVGSCQLPYAHSHVHTSHGRVSCLKCTSPVPGGRRRGKAETLWHWTTGREINWGVQESLPCWRQALWGLGLNTGMMQSSPQQLAFPVWLMCLLRGPIYVDIRTHGCAVVHKYKKRHPV